jgi:hypothetical protein
MVEAAGVELSKTPFLPRACPPFRWFTSRSVPLDPAEIRPVWQRRGSDGRTSRTRDFQMAGGCCELTTAAPACGQGRVAGEYHEAGPNRQRRCKARLTLRGMNEAPPVKTSTLGTRPQNVVTAGRRILLEVTCLAGT